MKTIRKIFPFILCALVMSSLFFIPNSTADLTEEKSKFVELGAIDRRGVEAGEEDIHSDVRYSGDGIEITQEEIDRFVERSKISGYFEPTQETAIISLIINRAVFCKALKSGFAVSEDELSKLIESDREEYKQLSNFDEFLLYVEGMDMTYDEYWDSMYTNKAFYRDTVSNGYLTSIRDKFVEEGKLMLGTETYFQDWKRIMDGIRIEAVAEGNIISTETGKLVFLEFDNDKLILKEQAKPSEESEVSTD